MSANGPIDYLLPEIWPLDYEKDNTSILNNASLKAKEVYYRHKHLLDWKNNLQLDTFVEASAIDIIDHYEPDILFIHQASLDHARHVSGTQSQEVDEALKLDGDWIKNIMDMYKQVGLFEKTTFVILGDHGQLNIHQTISINEMLRRAGLIRTDGLNQVLDYDAYVQSAGISGHVYIENKEVKEEMLKILEEIDGKSLI